MPKVTKKTKEPKWWTDMSPKEQKAYLKEHKNTKLKVTKRTSKKTIDKLDSEQSVKTNPIKRKVAKSVSADTKTFVDKNLPKVQAAVETVVSDTKRNIKAKVDSLSNKDKVQVGKLIKKAVTSDSSVYATKAAALLLTKLGIATVGVAAAASVGVPVALSLILLYRHGTFINDKLDKLPINNMITGFLDKFFDGVKEGLKDPAVVREALTTDSPDVVGEQSEKASVLPMNTTDLIKAFGAIQKRDWNKELANLDKNNTVNGWTRAYTTLRFMYSLEQACRDLQVLRSKFLGEQEFSYADKSDRLLINLSSMCSKVNNRVKEIARTDFSPADVAHVVNAICHRAKIDKNKVDTSLLLHDRCIHPVRVIPMDTAKLVYVGCTGNKSILLGMTSVAFSTPTSLDVIDRKLSLSKILRDYEVIG